MIRTGCKTLLCVISGSCFVCVLVSIDVGTVLQTHLRILISSKMPFFFSLLRLITLVPRSVLKMFFLLYIPNQQPEDFCRVLGQFQVWYQDVKKPWSQH